MFRIENNKSTELISENFNSTVSTVKFHIFRCITSDSSLLNRNPHQGFFFLFDQTSCTTHSKANVEVFPNRFTKCEYEFRDDCTKLASCPLFIPSSDNKLGYGNTYLSVLYSSSKRSWSPYKLSRCLSTTVCTK